VGSGPSAAREAYDVHRAAGGELRRALELRRRVFCEEQGVSEEEEYDGRDEDALHLVAVRDGRVLGTCRLLRDGDTVKLGRMAVEAMARGRGIGTALLVAGEQAARADGAARIALHAQTGVERFYADQGFVTRGPRFEQARIEHVAMEKSLA
jgi:predicted GNAT family N-acyltransferase